MERCVAWSAAAGLAAIGALGLAGAHFWVFDLLSHFRLHLAVACAVIASAWGMRRLLGPASVTLALALFLAGSGGPWRLSAAAHAEHERGSAEPLRVVLANVSLANEDRALPVRLRERHAPDVLGFLEVDHAWARALEAALPDHPHRLVEPRSHHFGLAIFSRLPLAETEVLFVNEEHHPALRVTVVLGGESVDLLLAHAHPPLSARTSALRDRQLAALARIRNASDRPFVLLGDLNATPWSAPFRRLLRSADLRDTRIGFGNQPTWPVPFARLGLPVDHVLVTPEWIVVDRQTGPAVGSDHLPVFAELRLGRSGPR